LDLGSGVSYRPKPDPAITADPATFTRDLSADRPLLSANDWWGFGFLMGLTGFTPSPVRRRYYCGYAGAMEQYKLGLVCAQEMEIAEVMDGRT
jgi:hypothetical protein